MVESTHHLAQDIQQEETDQYYNQEFVTKCRIHLQLIVYSRNNKDSHWSCRIYSALDPDLEAQSHSKLQTFSLILVRIFLKICQHSSSIVYRLEVRQKIIRKLQKLSVYSLKTWRRMKTTSWSTLFSIWWKLAVWMKQYQESYVAFFSITCLIRSRNKP